MKIIKKTINRILRKFGYTISKINILNGKKRDVFKITDFVLENLESFYMIYKSNRQCQKDITNWLSQEVYDKSVWNYGINSGAESINKIEYGITYTDLLVYASQFIGKPSYFEIGVSAGKNFWQLLNQLKNSEIYGLDVEVINPVLSDMLDIIEQDEHWDFNSEFKTFKGELIKRTSSLSSYSYKKNNNSVKYLCCDKFSQNSWEKLKGKKFNIIFSDSFHTANSILHEKEMILKYNLLDAENFIIIWDDLSAEMGKACLNIVIELEKHFQIFNGKFFTTQLFGSYGIGGKHSIGVYTNIKELISK